MSKSNLFQVTDEAVTKVQNTIEGHSDTIMRIVDGIIKPYCKDLDKYVDFIRDCLRDGETPPTTDELDDFCLNLSTLIYYASGMCEQLGIRDDISKTVYKEVYNSRRAELTEGTVADKDSLAELRSQAEQLTNICYNRAYRIMKTKVESAQELMSSCKKVLSRRMSEYELTHMQR